MRLLSIRIRLGILAVLGVSLSATAQAPADLRVALVIGNASYALAPLVNPANDARAMSEALKTMGFTVVEARDASRAQMEAAIAQVRDALKGRQGVGMLYYAGHGLQLDWRNYMVPVDAKIVQASDVAAQTVDVQAVLDAFKAAGNRMNIIVLDACRDNPFGATASGKGLAQVDAPPGTLLAFATAPGNVAEDGNAASGNGLYTQHLVQELRQPNAKIEDVFKRVRWQVRKASQGRQVPWESTSLEDDFYFDPKVKIVRLAESERAREAAVGLVTENAEWTRIKGSRDPNEFYAFLQKYPSGLLSEQAQFRLDQMQKAQVRPQAPATGLQPLPSGTNRYLAGDELVYDRIDGYTKAATRVTKRVTYADNDRVEINGGDEIYDQMGSQVLSRFGRKDPPILTAPAELSVGKRWRSAYTNTRPDGVSAASYYDFKVVALEEVTVPAGRFMAFKVERSGEARGKDFYNLLSGTAWIDPATMLEVRNDALSRSGGRIMLYYSEVLVSMKRASRGKS